MHTEPASDIPALLLMRVRLGAIDASHLVTDTSEDDRIQAIFPCGLSIIAETDRENNCVLIYANRPEPEHVLQHLFLRESPLWRADTDSAEWSEILKRPQDEKVWNIFRQDDAGNVFPVYSNLREQEARCILRLFEERGHKQIYWTERRED